MAGELLDKKHDAVDTEQESEVESDFFRISRGVANKFLNTAILIDDKATFDDPPSPTSSPKSPGARAEAQNDGGNGTNGQNEVLRHDLYAKKTMTAFASRGIICSVLKMNNSVVTANITTISDVAKRSDIIIIDWEIEGDANDGDTAVSIIEKVLESDANIPRLRLIIIYTADDLAEPMGRINTKFGFVSIKPNALAKASTRISFYNKARILEDDLPDMIIDEFTEMTMGIVSNVVLSSMSVLRDNMHLLLGCLGPDIDAPYLSHRVLLPHPEEAQYHAIDIIASEFRSMLYDYDVGNIANENIIKSWLDFKKPAEHDTYSVQFGSDERSIQLEDMGDLIVNGYKKSKIMNDYLISKKTATDKMENEKDKLDRKTDSLTKTFCKRCDNSELMDYRFAILTSLRNKYILSDKIPVLTQGTVLQEIKTSESGQEIRYWLCIQPRCDCVRIDEKRSFFFLSLIGINDDEKKKFDILIDMGENKYKKLRVDQTTYEAKAFEFKKAGQHDTIIKAVKNLDQYYFKTDDNNTKFKWLTELKFEHTQRIVNEFVGKMSRVGLDESEWLRRNTPRSQGLN